jgi:hypothetical protein
MKLFYSPNELDCFRQVTSRRKVLVQKFVSMLFNDASVAEIV